MAGKAKFKRPCPVEKLRNSICFDTCVVASALDAENIESLFRYADDRKIIVPFEVLQELVSMGEPHLKLRVQRLIQLFERPGISVLRGSGLVNRREYRGKSPSIELGAEFMQNLAGTLSEMEREVEKRLALREAALEGKTDLYEIDKKVRVTFREFDQPSLAEKIVNYPGLRGLDTKTLREIWEIFERIYPSFRKFKRGIRGNRSPFHRRFYTLTYLRMMLNGLHIDVPGIGHAKKMSRNNWEDTKIATMSWYSTEIVTSDQPFYDFLRIAKTPAELDCAVTYWEPGALP